ncbi:hypothetical protein WAI453_005209 [Rhynchosporium graminicola]
MGQITGQGWGRWPEQNPQHSNQTFYSMDISGNVQSYDPRAASSAVTSRTIMAPHYGPAQTYSAAPSQNMVVTQQQHQHNPFSYGGYSAPPTNILVPSFNNCNFIQQRPLPRLMQVDDHVNRQQVSYPRVSRPGFIEEYHSQSPSLRSEPMWPSPTVGSVHHSTGTKNSPALSSSQEIDYKTEVDTLMKAIQAKPQTTEAQAVSPPEQITSVAGAFRTPLSTLSTNQVGMYAPGEEMKDKLTQKSSQDSSDCSKNSKKRYQCKIANCRKSFYQKTHLDIHERSHTGVKPYACTEPGCGRAFSQLGNLKTHERRHSGERPYGCEICGKRFAQRGNVRAHKITHDKVKPFPCRLDDCSKYFTQLGNLKHDSHQNKFHKDTIRNLTAKFASIKEGDFVHAADKELWQYFANLYKNSNKGIKGRGKDRKVGSTSASSSLNAGMRSLCVGQRGFGMAGSGRGHLDNGIHIGMDVGMNIHIDMAGHVVGRSDGHGHGHGPQYHMYDVDDASQSGSGSSVGNYDDAPSDGYESQGSSGHDMSFGDRMY